MHNSHHSGLQSHQIQFGPASWTQTRRILIDWTCKFLVMDYPSECCCHELTSLHGTGQLWVWSTPPPRCCCFLTSICQNCQQKPPVASNHIAPSQHLQFFPYVLAISDCHKVSVIFWFHSSVIHLCNKSNFLLLCFSISYKINAEKLCEADQSKISLN